MPRTAKKAATTENENVVDTEALQESSKQLSALQTTHERNMNLVDSEYAIDAPYSLENAIASLAYLKEDTGRKLLEMGRLLLLIREHESTEIYNSVLDRCGISFRFAQRVRQAALKFSGNDLRKTLASKLGSSKILELMGEDDDAIDGLSDGGSIAGITLDDIERMTTRELKQALRVERKETEDELAARDEIIARKDDKLQKLELKNKRGAKAPIRTQAEDIMFLISERSVEHLKSSESLRLAIAEVYNLYSDAGEPLDEDIDTRLDFFAQAALKSAKEIAETARS